MFLMSLMPLMSLMFFVSLMSLMSLMCLMSLDISLVSRVGFMATVISKMISSRVPMCMSQDWPGD